MLLSLMPNARDNLWEELKNICNKNYDLQGVTILEIYFKSQRLCSFKRFKGMD